MSDPAVCCFLTRTLCAQGGRLAMPELQKHVGLSMQQLEETLSAAGPQRFLVLRDGSGGAEVLAVSAVRVCTRQQCGGCDRLHLCKLHLMGRCNRGPRFCKYSHDIINAENKKVLKTHELSGLEENELQVLLLQNDPFFLPDVCQFYNRKDNVCNQQSNCNKLHICGHFLQGQCRFLSCKRSHNLLDSHALRVLDTGGISMNIASNIQTICSHKHVAFNNDLKQQKMYKPRPNLRIKTYTKSQELMVPSQAVSSVSRVPPSEGPGSDVPDQSQHQLPAGARGGEDKDKKDDSSAKASEEAKEENYDEICVYNIWKYCKNNDKCRFIHYHLPYRWQVYNGITWNDLAMMEEIEKAYCDPKNTSIAHRSINFQAMTAGDSLLRRLSTVSSVTKPTFVLTTKWIWYWRNDQGQWIEYGEQGEGDSVNSPSSDVIEDLYLADPAATIPFKAGLFNYQLNFKDMIQTNTSFKTQRLVRRRPKFVSSEDVQKIKKGLRDSSIPNKTCPVHWDPSAQPDLGYK